MDVSYISPIMCSMSILEGSVPCAGDHITSGKGCIKVRFPGDFELRVYNASGELVKASKGRDEVSLDLRKGVYFVVVENRIIRRVVVW